MPRAGALAELEHAIDAVMVIALVLAVASLIVAGLAWQQARDARAMAEKAAQRVGELADAAPRTSVAPVAAVVATPVLIASPPLAPPEVAGLEHHASLNETGATLVVRSGSAAGQDLPTNQGTGSGLIGIFLFNQGPATAHDLQLTATFPTGIVRRSTANHTLSARKEGTLFVQIVPQDFGPSDTVSVDFRVRYRDVNGEHEIVQKVRLEGGWKGPWTTYLAEPATDHAASLAPAAPVATATIHGPAD